MSIIYLISMIVLYISIFLYKKVDKRMNFVNQVFITFVCLICYNILISYVMTLFSIPIYYFTYGGITFTLSSFLLYRIYKRNCIQKFYFNKTQAIIVMVLMVLGVFICMYNFSFNFSVAYETTDPNVHYMSAYAFSKNTFLLSKPSVLYPIYGSMDALPISYANIGMLFKGVEDYINPMGLYKIYIGYDCFMYLLAIGVFYTSVQRFINTKNKLVITLIITVFFMLGYPLTNLKFGFRYLGDTVIMVNVLLYAMDYFHRCFEKSDRTQKNLLLACIGILNFTIFLGYYLFLPFIYAALFVYFIYHSCKNHYFFKKEYFVLNLITLGIPAILGIIFIFTPLMKGGVMLANNGGPGFAEILATEGYIYRDLYSNFIFFIPFLFWYFVKQLREKKVNFTMLLTIFLTLFLLVLFVLGMFSKASSYYFFKNYFVLWVIVFYITVKVMCDLMNEEKITLFLNCVVATVLILFITFVGQLDHFVAVRNPLYNIDSKAVKYFDIYASNKVYIEKGANLSADKLDTLEFFNDNIISKTGEYKRVPVIGDTLQRLWTFALIRAFPNKVENNTFGPFYDDPYTLKEALKSNNEHIIGYCRLTTKMGKDVLSAGYHVLYSNDESFVLEKYK